MIRPCDTRDFDTILAVINDAAEAYRAVIPEDRFHDPYMDADALGRDIDAGVRFWGAEDGGALIGVMGLQAVGDVTLIRHAYVLTARRRRGVGGRLLAHLRANHDRPFLIGTWAATGWAIDFYRKHGFERVPDAQVAPLLRRYWSIPERQIETSVVLADDAWRVAGSDRKGETP